MKSQTENKWHSRVAQHLWHKGKVKEAAARQAVRDLRSDEEQYNLLVARGAGSCKEAGRLMARIIKANPSHGEQPKPSRPARKRRNKPASLM